MQLTACICTHNRPHYVRDCLEGLARQTVGSEAFAVLVVDSGSTGNTPAELVRLIGEIHNASLIRLNQPGISLARNAGAWACHTSYIAYIDDDAIPAPDWVACILAAIAEVPRAPAVLGGRVLPRWEIPLPEWWPPRLRGLLSIIETEGQGEFGDPSLPHDLCPYG
jgi:glycosyltransferase involved in cell wall biosynthesis